METPSSMLLQILAACPAPLAPAWITTRAIGASAASTPAKSPRLAADHEGQGAGVGRRGAAGDRRVGEAEARPPRLAATARALSTSMVEQSIKSAPLAALGRISSA